jgi:hypothetical protein
MMFEISYMSFFFKWRLQVETRRGHVTAEEFGIFAVAVHCVIDRYMRVRETLAEIARKREEEKNKFKLEAERRKVRDR